MDDCWQAKGLSMSGTICARFEKRRDNSGGFLLDVDLMLPGHGVTALFGPSGSGKTTVLRCIAGLERSAIAYLEINGEVWQDSARGYFLPTHRRPLGYVFQEASLFAHLSVKRNLEYGLRRSDQRAGRAVWQQTMEMLGIGHLLARMPAMLSGGERQRVAIARALLTSPKLLLMDEPLAALDQARKMEILPHLERLRDELAIPLLYVSHQPDEVARLADHLVLLEQGRALACGPLPALLARLDLALAAADDAAAVLEVTVAQHDDHYQLMRLDFAGGQIFVPQRDIALGKRLRLQVHARDVSLALAVHEDSSILNRVQGTVVDVVQPSLTTHAAHALVLLDVGGSALLARITRRSCDQLRLFSGQRLWAQIKSVALLA
jgi:molybdate transport system ATP-binding protein